MDAKGGADRSRAVAADGEAGSPEGPDCTKPGRVRHVEWQVGDTGAEGASVKQTGQAQVGQVGRMSRWRW